MSIAEHWLCCHRTISVWILRYPLGLLESPATAKSQPSGRGNQIFSQNVLILGGINYAILTSAPGPLQLICNSPKTWLTHHHISPWVWGTSPCMSLCSYAKHADAVPDKNVQFWSHLTRAPCSRLSSGNPSNEAVVMLTPRRHQGLQFFHCDPSGFCCFCHHSPQDPGGQDAVASFPHEIFNSSISFELLYNCSDSAQWYIQSFAHFLVAITTFMKVYHLPLLNCQFFCFLHGVGWQRDIACVSPHFYTLVKQEVR